MSRRRGRNNDDSDVRGPTSALSSFLRERGIRAPRLNPYARLPNAGSLDANAAPAANGSEGNEGAAQENGENGEASVTNAAADGEEQMEEAEAEENVQQDEEQEEEAAAATYTQTASSRRRASAVSKAKEKATKGKEEKEKAKRGKKRGKGKKGEDDESDSEDDKDNNFENFGSKLAPRSGHSKRRKTENDDGGLNGTVVQFCQRCLRKYIPVEEETLCTACLTIPNQKNGSGKLAAVKRRKAKLVDEVLDGCVLPLKTLCMKVVASNIDQVEAFGDIPDEIKRSISRILSRQRQINSTTIKLFIGPEEQKVELFDCARLNENLLSQIAMFSVNVRVLNLSDCGQMTDSAIRCFAEHCPNITSLTLKGPFLVTDAAFADLFAALGDQLQSVFLENAAKLSAKGIGALIESAKPLKGLGLSHCMSLGDEGVSLLKSLTSLETLELMDLAKVSDNVINEVLKAVGSNLTKLWLIGFSDMTDEVLLNGIAPHCTQLEELSLKNNEAITNEGMVKFLNTWRTRRPLKALDFSRLIQLQDDSLNSLITLHGPSLEHLALNGLDDLTGHSLRSLLAGGCPLLQTVDLSWIRNVDDDRFEELVTKNPELVSVKVYGCNRLTEFSLVKKFSNSRGEVIHVIGNEFD
ncbi:hypothetical protein HDU76_000261 [Blyttiomyces sp. JEL0837]|nr:hypothetical protein HDU76_000261 [Blyttiomyces sp. JEL0837]